MTTETGQRETGHYETRPQITDVGERAARETAEAEPVSADPALH